MCVMLEWVGAKAKHYNGRRFNAFRDQCRSAKGLNARMLFEGFVSLFILVAEVGDWDTSRLESNIYAILASDMLGYNVDHRLGGASPVTCTCEKDRLRQWPGSVALGHGLPLCTSGDLRRALTTIALTFYAFNIL